jgi:hypothetical protein
MWSLPDIAAMNKRAEASRLTLEQRVEAINSGKSEEKCDTCNAVATRAELIYDIFSDDPKNLVAACAEHEIEDEDNFTCVDCDRLMVLNYTWEIYRSITEEGDELCLPCAAKRYIADDSNWINLTPEEIAMVDVKRLTQCKHVIGVKMPIPKGIEFVDNFEFDSGNLQQISGRDWREVLTEQMNAGRKRAILILDAAYQFAVSIGIYVDAEAKSTDCSLVTLSATH